MRSLYSALFFSVLVVFHSHAGVALRLYYRDIRGLDMAQLKTSATFPQHPTDMEPVVTSLERLEDAGNDYGSWTRGYIEAPETGKYIFSVAGDDQSEFWLSTTHMTGDLKLIAGNLYFVSPRNFSGETNQRSAPIPLTRGEKYYFELYHKEARIHDFISLDWRLPSGIEEPVPASRLMPFPIDDSFQRAEKAPQFLTSYYGTNVSSLSNTTVTVGATVTLAVTLEGTQPITLQWLRNGKAIPEANLSTLTLTNLQLEDDQSLFTVFASNKLGVAKAEGLLSVKADREPPRILSVFDTGESRTLAVLFSEAMDSVTATQPENYGIDGKAVIQRARMSASPNVVLLDGPPLTLTSNKSQALTVNNVKDLGGNRIAPKTSATIEKGLQLWLKFDDENQNVATDSSGNDQHLTLWGDPDPKRSGKIGRCLTFDGKKQYGELPEGFSDIAKGMTIALWARPTARSSWARFIELGNGQASDNVILARDGTAYHLYFEVLSGRQSGKKVRARNRLEMNQWQHFAATLDHTGRVRLYKNGEFVVEDQTAAPRGVVRTKNYVGKSSWPTNELYAGSMDDLRIYDRPLSPEQIKALSNLSSSLK